MNDTAHDDETRYRLFKLIEEHPDMSQRKLAEEMGVSVGKLNYCLRALADVGLIKMGNFARSQRKLGYAYLLTPKGIAEKGKVTARFLAKKEAEYQALQDQIELLRDEAAKLESIKMIEGKGRHQ